MHLHIWQMLSSKSTLQFINCCYKLLPVFVFPGIKLTIFALLIQCFTNWAKERLIISGEVCPPPTTAPLFLQANYDLWFPWSLCWSQISTQIKLHNALRKIICKCPYDSYLREVTSGLCCCVLEFVESWTTCSCNIDCLMWNECNLRADKQIQCAFF